MYTIEKNILYLRKVYYILKRMVDFESSWVTELSDFNDKINLAISLNHTVNALSAIEKTTSEYRVNIDRNIAPSERIKLLFDSQSRTKKELDIKKFIFNSTQSLIISIEKNMAEFCSLFDKNSLDCLKITNFYLNEKITIINNKNWRVDKKYLIEIIPNEPHLLVERKAIKPELSSIPSRPKEIKELDSPILQSKIIDLVKSTSGRQIFLHFMYTDIEICAAEICARNIAKFSSSMPLSFIQDMALQCSDEARHALMADKMLKENNGFIGQYGYSLTTWNSYIKGDTLQERLAIEQIISEGNGLDSAARTLDAFKEHGLVNLERFHKYIISDEIQHCGYGNKWLVYLTKNSEKKYFETIKLALKKSGLSPPNKLIYENKSRELAGFPESFLKTLS